MTKKPSSSRAKNYFYILTLFFIIAQIIFITVVEVVGNGDIAGCILLTCFFLFLIFLTIQGYKSAKWLLSVFLVIFSILFSIAGFEIPSLKLKLVGAYYLFFGLIPHFSNNLKPITIATNQDSINDSKETAINIHIDARPRYDLPYLLDRYKAVLIDSLLIMSIVITCMSLNSYFEFDSQWVLVIYFTVAFSYEPVLTSYSSTIGQKIMKIRVRDINFPEKRINLGQSYIRFMSKALLGWLSFITISFNKNKRAIHDFAASSVVISL